LIREFASKKEKEKKVAEECILIDDIRGFVAVAKFTRMQTILFKDSEQLKFDLEALGIMI
jgi:hypothetical protein